MDRLKPGRWMFEVYPHPAQIILFDLPTIIGYKKPNVVKKREGLSTFRRLIWEQLSSATPPLFRNNLLRELVNKDLELLRGQSLKRYEDAIDAVFCSYLALYYWSWGGEKNEMIGDLYTGYIINPTSRVS